MACEDGPRDNRAPQSPLCLVTARIRQAAMARPTATATAPSRSFANEEFPMTDAANHLVPKQGKFRRALAAVNTWLLAWTTPASTTLSIASNAWNGRWDN